jgi:hypothetical protein
MHCGQHTVQAHQRREIADRAGVGFGNHANADQSDVERALCLCHAGKSPLLLAAMKTRAETGVQWVFPL